MFPGRDSIQLPQSCLFPGSWLKESKARIKLEQKTAQVYAKDE